MEATISDLRILPQMESHMEKTTDDEVEKTGIWVIYGDRVPKRRGVLLEALIMRTIFSWSILGSQNLEELPHGSSYKNKLWGTAWLITWVSPTEPYSL